MRQKRCPYCRGFFIPHPRVGKRQKTCGRPSCQKALKRENNARWRRRHPDYFRNDYPRLKAWLDEHPGYLRCYRATHPEYVQKNRQAKRLRDRRRRLQVDIQAKIKRQHTAIIDKLRDFPHVDIQDEIALQPLEMTFLFSTFPCVDIQVPMDKRRPLKDTAPIEARR